MRYGYSILDSLAKGYAMSNSGYFLNWAWRHKVIPMACVLLAPCYLWPLGACDAFQPGDRPDAMVEYLLQANAANFESFAFVQTKFTVTLAYAHGLENGLKGIWLDEPEPVVGHVFWAFDHETFRRSETYSNETIAKHERWEGGFLHRTYTNIHTCWNSDLQLEAEAGQIFQVRTKKAGYAEGFQPFSVGLAQKVLRDRATIAKSKYHGGITYLGERDLEGRRLPVLESQMHFDGYRDDNLQIDDIWVDPEHGYLPKRVDTYYMTKSKPRMTTIVQEFKELGHGRWMPAMYRYVNMTADPVRCHELRVLEVDADNPPSPEIFEMRVPEHTSRGGHNNITNENYLAKQGRVSLASFRSDGTLRPDQDELELNTAIRSSPSPGTTLGTNPDQGPSQVSVWPFAQAKPGNGITWTLIALASTLLVVALLLRKWARAR